MGKFLYFPLGLLSPVDADWHVTLERIECYCLRDVGYKCMDRMETWCVDGLVAGADVPEDCDENDDEHRAIAVGARMLDFDPPSFDLVMQRAEEAQRIISAHERRFGPLVMVNIWATLLRECHDDEGLSFRDLCTLCGVNSIIGQKVGPVIVRRDLVIARQIGFKTMEAMAEALSDPCRRPLSASQVKTSLDRLEKRGLITRFAGLRRTTFFRLGKVPTEEMHAQVAHILERGFSLANRRKEDRAFISGLRRRHG